ncbi:Delta(3,5)-Delta(2,4)-dienoyl-CoA isomerase, mitochondrial [Papilio machaon]|uniref:Delta(3,5)-Delta(2,4)-dienoyl-CoA isomerase, mitochondrial n=1 Tax=Papilio machaon TaxID=76193 RepID=A0A0N0PEG6_PAPMA|nr:Delta(3,5)-Delta(2,4)-dienoyl-CoA isomerase, mitochondrial [Papilio machaon]
MTYLKWKFSAVTQTVGADESYCYSSYRTDLMNSVIGNTSIARELCYTARKLPAKEALDIGLVSKVFPDRDSAIQQVLEVAQTIASKSPVAVQVTKQSLVYSQSRPTSEGLEHIRLINQTMLQSDDLTKAAISQATKTEAEFDDL